MEVVAGTIISIGFLLMIMYFIYLSTSNTDTNVNKEKEIENLREMQRQEIEKRNLEIKRQEIERRNREIKQKEIEEKEQEEKIKKEQEKKEEYVNFKNLYKKCLVDKLFENNFEENKEKFLELSKSFNITDYQAEDIVLRICNMENIKNIMCSNYYFVKILNNMIKKDTIATLKEDNEIYEFMCLLEQIYSDNILEDYISISNKNINVVSLPLNGKYNNSTAFKNLLYYKYIIDIIKNDAELYTIYCNLLKSYENNEYIDYEYVSKKMYDIYTNIYKEKYKINIKKKEFENIFILMQERKDINEYSVFYRLVFKDYKTAKAFPKEIYDNIFLKKNMKFNKEDVYYYYIVDNKSSLSLCEICEILLNMDKKIKRYNKIIEKEKEIIKKENTKEKLKKEQERLKKEQIRLLKGDLSKENKLNSKIQEKENKKRQLELEYTNIENGYDFEEYIAKFYEKLGYKIEEVTKKSGDQGADVVAYKDNLKYVIQVKFYSSPVGNKAVQEVVAAIGMYKADKGIVVTNNTFTESALELAQANNIELVNGNKIEELKKEILAKT